MRGCAVPLLSYCLSPSLSHWPLVPSFLSGRVDKGGLEYRSALILPHKPSLWSTHSHGSTVTMATATRGHSTVNQRMPALLEHHH